ncbi:WD40 repeat domain-containing protein [Kitasatospora nipponensis]|uniref:WD40 repeat domain-containing protein n=1 Tax=Kitasatospora nipponensis TaxID=258049 RepID=UPI0031DF846F
MSEEGQADGVTAFAPLPAVAQAARELASALARAGVATGGNPLLECDRDVFMSRWRDLRRNAAPGEPLIVHYAGHGTRAASGGLFLAAAGATGTDELLVDTCVSFGQLLEAAAVSGRPVLFLLDVCEAGQAVIQQQLAEIAARRPQEAEQGVWIIGACASDTATYGARFTTATTEILHRLTDGDLDLSSGEEFVPIATLAQEINRHLARADAACGRPRQRVVHTPQIHADTQSPPFFRNPAHRLQAGLPSGLDPSLRELALACSPGLDPLHFAGRAAGNPTATDILFSGRTSHLQRIQDWTHRTGTEQSRLLAVTGGPGSGKSALLGVTACLLHPELEDTRQAQNVARAVEHFDPRRSDTVLAVHARQLTVQQITDSLRHQLRRQRATTHSGPAPAPPAGEPDGADTAALVAELRQALDVLLVVDALDEATDPAAVLNELLLPLTDTRGTDGTGCRIILGTRPWWDTLPTLRHHLDRYPAAELDLDPSTADDRRTLADDLDTYLRKLLLPRSRFPRTQVRHIAERLAQYSDHGAFLVAALYADHLRTTPARAPAGPPCTVTEVFDLHVDGLAATEPWIRPVLEVLGRARGQGMPLDLVHHAALAHRPPDPGHPAPQLRDTRRVLTKAAFYLRTSPDSDHRLLYRYFHQSLTEHIRDQSDPAAIHRALIGAAPHTPDGAPDWEQAQPYLLRHAADHAREADDGALDHLLEDPRFLVHAEPDTLTPHLLFAGSDKAVLHARVYRTTAAHDPERLRSRVRRDFLALDAASWQAPELARALSRTSLEGQPAAVLPLWATHRISHPTLLHTLTDDTGEARYVVTATFSDGTPIAVTLSDRTAVVWDLATGARLHTLAGHSAWVDAVATAVLPEGTPIAVTCGADATAVVWDLVTGAALHSLTGHTGTARSVTTGVLFDGTPIAVTLSDRIAVVWDLATGARLHTLAGHSAWVDAVATAVLPEGTPIAVTCGADATVIVWDLVTGAALHSLTDCRVRMNAVATAVLPDGTAVAVATSDDLTGTDVTAAVWDLTTGSRLHTLAGHARRLNGVITAVLPDGTAVAVTLGDRTAVVWDLTTGTELHTLAGHTDSVYAAATTILADGLPIVLTSSADATAMAWDLTTGNHLQTLTGHTGHIQHVAVAVVPNGAPLAVTSDTGTAIVWNLSALLHPLSGHSADVLSVTAGALRDGTSVAVTAGADRTVVVRDLTTGSRLHTITGPAESVSAVATANLPDGTPLAITLTRHAAIVWNLTTGTRLHTLTGNTRRKFAVATGRLPDGTAIILTAGNEGASVWDLTTGTRLHTLEGHSLWAEAVAVTALPDGTPLAVTAGYEEAVVWNLATGTRLYGLTGHGTWVEVVATAALPDGTPLAVTIGNGEALIWDLSAGTRRHSLTGLTTWPEDVATAALPDGTPLAVIVSEGPTADVWDLTTGARRHTLRGHAERVNAVTATSLCDGTPLAVTTGADRAVLVWDLTTGAEVARFHLPHPGTSAWATPSGCLLGYGCETAYLSWDGVWPPGAHG